MKKITFQLCGEDAFFAIVPQTYLVNLSGRQSCDAMVIHNHQTATIYIAQELSKREKLSVLHHELEEGIYRLLGCIYSPNCGNNRSEDFFMLNHQQLTVHSDMVWIAYETLRKYIK